MTVNSISSSASYETPSNYDIASTLATSVSQRLVRKLCPHCKKEREFTNEEKHLQIRAFDDNEKRQVYEIQDGICPDCGKHFEISEMEAHHKKRWVDGGHTNVENCVMLCKECHDNRHIDID